LRSDLPLIEDAVTVEQLLAHTSGIGDYLDEEDDELGPVDYVLKRPVHELASTQGFVPEIDGYPMKAAPGERFSYSNSGYVVLALITERAGGGSYHELVTSRVLHPARLTDTAFLRSDEPSGRMALGYLGESGLRTNVLHLPVRGNGDGGIYTTAADMHRFWRALFDGRIVAEQWVTTMTSPVSAVPDKHARCGLGFWLAEDGPTVRLIGADAGVSFTSAHDPTSGSTWTVLSNTTSGAWPIVRYLQSELW
jgi:CubicO group peptidase (beta-lactamase class C family)